MKKEIELFYCASDTVKLKFLCIDKWWKLKALKFVPFLCSAVVCLLSFQLGKDIEVHMDFSTLMHQTLQKYIQMKNWQSSCPVWIFILLSFSQLF